jgi:hypothetical protein
MYISTRRWDLPTCPRCGCRSALFAECPAGSRVAFDGRRGAFLVEKSV